MLAAADHHAMHQGYCLDLYDDGFRLRRIPAATAFKDDAATWRHVFDMTHAGEPLATQALKILAQHGPLKFRPVGQYVALYRRDILADHAI